ncbi:MAG TPA: hypothetical protein VGR65_01930 [Casimicrobiaceae bacterium]|nr:hypothetical protein [Casimicrobiaceae bacterium]
MATAKGTAGVPVGTAPVSHPRWWAAAGALLGVALGVVLFYAVVTRSTGHWTDAPAPIVAAGADLTLTRGAGHKDGKSFVLESTGAEGVAVLTAKLSPFQAKDFPRVEWTLDSAQPPDELFFIWRTRERPKLNHVKRLQWLVTGVAPLELKADDGWSGTVTGVALLVRSGLAAPLRIASVRIVSRSANATASELVQQWGARNALRGYSATFPFDAERAHDLPLLTAIAVAEGLAMCAYLLLARWREWRRDRRVLWGIFLGGWLLLDLRWQANLWREVRERGHQFAGKTTEEKHLAADDAALFVLVEKMKSGLPATPARVVLYCDNDLLCARAAFLIYPQNVYRAVHRKRELPHPDELRGGDFLLLFYSKALGYDRERQLAVWPNGGSKPADEILLQPEALLLRIR